MGRGHPRGFIGLDGRVPRSVVAAALCAAGLEHVRFRDLARHPTLHRARELAGVPQFPDRNLLAAWRAEGLGGASVSSPARVGALCGDEEPVRPDRKRVRSLPKADRGWGCKVRHYVEPHPRRDGEPRFRPGGSGSGRAEPHGVRDILPGTPPLLRPGRWDLPVRRELQPGELQQRRSVLLAARWSRAAAVFLR